MSQDRMLETNVGASERRSRRTGCFARAGFRHYNCYTKSLNTIQELISCERSLGQCFLRRIKAEKYSTGRRISPGSRRTVLENGESLPLSLHTQLTDSNGCRR